MKKAFSSEKDINKMALKLGATVTDSKGGKFNSTRTAKPAKVLKNRPQPKSDVDKMSESMNSAISRNNSLIQSLMAQIGDIKLEAPERPTEWDFEIVRDDNGYIKTIKARGR